MGSGDNNEANALRAVHGAVQDGKLHTRFLREGYHFCHFQAHKEELFVYTKGDLS